MSNNLIIVLKAKSKGDYQIGPAILKKGKEEIKTNILNIKITGDKLFLNNNHLNIPKINNNNNNKINNVSKIQNTNNNPKKQITNKGQQNNIKSKEKQDKINKFNDIKQKNFTDKNSVYLLLVVSLLLGLGGFFIIKNQKSKDNLKLVESKEYIEKEDIDFDIKMSEIIYPELNNNNFINNITEILKQKIANKYKINKINNKTFDEIIEIIGDDIDIDTKELINIINRSKYSNIIGDNSKILELIKDYK